MPGGSACPRGMPGGGAGGHVCPGGVGGVHGQGVCMAGWVHATLPPRPDTTRYGR